MTIHIAPSATLVAPMTINFVSVRYSMTTPRLIHKECYKELNGVTACTNHPKLQADVDSLRLANIHLAERNKELNNDIERAWDYYHNHYDECPTSRDNLVATLCRFILRHT